MYAVRAADLHRVLEFKRPALQHFAQLLETLQQNPRSLADLQRLRRIHNVVRRHAVMEPARRFGVSGGRHGFGHGGRERDHVVPRLLFDFEDARNVERRVPAQQNGIFAGNDAQFRQRLRRRQFHFKPLLKLVLVAPDGAHFAARVTGNQYAKTSVGLFCSAMTRRGRRPRFSSDCSAPMRTISGWLLCSLRWPRISVWTPQSRSASR